MCKLLFIGLTILLLTACEQENNSFSGYVDTDLVYLSADFGGRLADLAVLRGQQVQNNQLLFKLEQTSELYNVQMSKLSKKDLLAQRQQILSQLKYNKINYRRILEMQKQNAASQNDLDAARRDLNISKDQLADIDVKIKNNQVDTADKKWQMTRKENFAPEPGIVFDTYYTKGEFVQAGAPVLALVTPNNIKAVFFVPEEKLDQLRLNQHVTLKTDTNPNFATGHIYYISNIAEYTPPIIYSREERQRLVFRVEAKIDTPDLEKIHLGQPVTLELA
ncbi:HlyD family efflux transporter periplasmic adaptor subunit [Fluoribacter dumoffii]|uniref:HlyD family secretion protein n=1 Tax=Fluoribacter dumoffii TaxID=463 RepID=UPI00224450AA|nr:HlyD family efflux transporter periplasmic adaptor subunit [Fluoribacter dumoffii]MCW8387751.1 HlyD family efflux transporter periplasmic adaptor subunit [Fluoribacter dumoffii]MCW8416690.1 HlyD family efflux transporter periplasmic adaptor subunit [Fluoribacter dumoffii]MCW8455470.1 HlyD family efflux transporter periplasmic adaptor subunit [Fluoribacter dumoffii]MCW8460452.1 HlyD family efflux transporter periplasmic adaptor subunit [Fluoribacter dumoffii]MCW8483932.1 HlyD family efflux t